MGRKITRFLPAQPPALDLLPFIHASDEVEHWLRFYWQKLKLPAQQLCYLAVTADRREFALWTGRRLNPMALGCYCFLPLPDEDEDGLAASGQHHLLAPDAMNATAAATRGLASDVTAGQFALPGFGSYTSVAVLDHSADALERPTNFRHLIFVEPGLLPVSIEITVAHELIHLADRVSGTPRKHHCHGHDSIATDEAAITERDPEELRALLREETIRREEALRKVRPYRYLYVCPACGREYRRVRRYARIVSCGNCDRQYNPAYLLRLHALLNSDGSIKEVLNAEG